VSSSIVSWVSPSPGAKSLQITTPTASGKLPLPPAAAEPPAPALAPAPAPALAPAPMAEEPVEEPATVTMATEEQEQEEVAMPVEVEASGAAPPAGEAMEVDQGAEEAEAPGVGEPSPPEVEGQEGVQAMDTEVPVA
jgi:hypothetical protein